MSEKIIKQWLEELPEPARSKAIKNTPLVDLKKKVDCLSDAVAEAFNWHESPEGQDYWDELWLSLYNSEKLSA